MKTGIYSVAWHLREGFWAWPHHPRPLARPRAGPELPDASVFESTSCSGTVAASHLLTCSVNNECWSWTDWHFLRWIHNTFRFLFVKTKFVVAASCWLQRRLEFMRKLFLYLGIFSSATTRDSAMLRGLESAVEVAGCGLRFSSIEPIKTLWSERRPEAAGRSVVGRRLGKFSTVYVFTKKVSHLSGLPALPVRKPQAFSFKPRAVHLATLCGETWWRPAIILVCCRIYNRKRNMFSFSLFFKVYSLANLALFVITLSSFFSLSKRTVLNFKTEIRSHISRGMQSWKR